jgi:hypothetical protein
MAKRNTHFVRQLFCREEGRVLAKVVSRSDDAILRVWTRVMTDTYPVQAYLYIIGAVQSPLCPHCSDNAMPLTHFACVCPKFREARLARTAAHNQLHAVVAACLKCSLSEDWHMFEEKCLTATGLLLEKVRAEEHYIHTGWSIEIFPWVVGIRGFVDTKHLHAALEYLAIPASQWKAMIENSVLSPCVHALDTILKC